MLPVVIVLVIFFITYLFIGLRQVPRVHIDRIVGALITVITISAGIMVLVVEVKIAKGADAPQAAQKAKEMTVSVTPAGKSGRARSFRVVLLCDTGESQRRGLQGFRQLAKDEAALFPYPTPGEVTFWMGSVAFPIDIIFVDPAMTVSRVYRDCRPNQRDLYPSPGPVRWVIETAAGSGVREGDRVRIE